jgi:hypothetical protein
MGCSDAYAEGVDWNNHVGAGHHIDGAKFGDIKYTEPFH